MSQQVAMLAVQAGIAAVDAICGHELGVRFRGQDHRQASSLLDQVRGAGDAVKAFGGLVAQKDTAEYSSRVLGSETLKSMTRALERLIVFMDEVLAR